MTLNSSSSSPLISNYAPVNYRQQTNGDVFGGQYPIQTPQGVVHTTQQSQLAPPLPPRPNSLFQTSSSVYSPYGNSMGYGSFGSGYGSYGMGGMGGIGGYNSFGMGGYGGFGRPQFGAGNPLDPEMRFIQMAEESSRSTFQSIESVVSTIGNIATMLDSTYFALTSSFRAILGLAANFSHLRGFFGRFFSTFAIFRSVIWIYKKLLYMVGFSKVNPSTQINLSEAFKDAEKVQSNDFFNTAASQQNSSGLAMVLFLTFVFTAPYLIMKLFGSLMNSTADQSKNPSSWINPIEAVVLYNFNADNPSELSVKAGQIIRIAPKEVQQLNRLLSTNWLLATVDGNNVGLVPVNYIKRNDVNLVPTTIPSIQSQINQQQEQNLNTQAQPTAVKEDITTKPPEITDKNENIS
ncbi:peroxisomal membrane protein PEX13 [Chironomus tepperi]|uniref:peroxisomal membrane protein PEX13 n=1 Tax=Chironomus tepperi TaxID=113505 RepID=UPI00391F10F8